MEDFSVKFIYTLDKGDLLMAKKVLTPAEVEIKALKKKYRKEKTEKIIPVILAGVIMSYLFGEGVGSISVFGTLVNSSSGIFSSFGGKITQYIGDIMWSSSVEILIFLAALQSVPDILYEVVEIDGATAWESFWHVTLPYISPFVILNCIYALVDSFTKYNNPVMSMMNEMTEKGTEYGMASALSWMYMLLALVTILIFILFTRRWLK